MNALVERVLALRSRFAGCRPCDLAVRWALTVGLWPLWLAVWLEDDPRHTRRLRDGLRDDLGPILEYLRGQ
jgi:hypothetical protein